MRKALHITLSILITISFVLLAIFVFSSSYLRFGETIRDLGCSIAFYFCEIFGIGYELPKAVGGNSAIIPDNPNLPATANSFFTQAKAYFARLFDADNFGGWWATTANKIELWSKVLLLALPCIILLILLIKKIYEKGNNRYDKDTIPLKAYKNIKKYTYEPVKGYITDFICFLRTNKWIWISWAAVWAFNLNLASIITAFLAFYFRFAMSFNFSEIYPQIRNLLVDLQVYFKTVPLWCHILLALIIFDLWRKKAANRKLHHFEAMDCGFINELPIVSISCGSMGKKKTTLITDMTLSQEVMFRQKAFEIMQNADLKFPHFAWIKFELELRACMEHHTVYNLASVKAWVQKKKERYDHHHNSQWQLYGYDVERYGFYYYNELRVSDLFDVLETYAQAYFVYVIEGSLIISNYSIRTDNELMDEGNFPIWLTDFFPKHNRDSERHAHILDFDTLRLGKKLIADNPNIGSFEFGVVAISEIGKERGNNLELQEKKKKDEETNQKNDLFNSWLKMCRHSATIDNFPFIKVFTDEQRPESWGADARDLCDIIHIAESGEQRLALPFYTIEDMISEWTFNKFINLYYDFRFRRGDNTLLVYILKSITAAIWRRNIRIYNRYGYSVLRIEEERGTMDGKTEMKKYYLMNRKIYSRRFSSDCFSDYFNDMARRSDVGLSDYPEYACEKATVEELKQQNSYFVNALYKHTKSEV